MNGLRYIMQLENMTTADVAKKMKVNRSLISVWQTGRRIIPNNRISELVGIFPKYPAYYFNKELTAEDMTTIREIKISGKAIGTPPKDERMSKVESVIKDQIAEHGRILTDIAKIMKLDDYTALLKSSDSISDKQLLTLLFSVVGASQKSYIHDYTILNNLERLKRDAEEHGREDYKLSLIGVAMSALSVAFGFEDDVSVLAVPETLREILPNDALKNDPNIKQFREWRDRIVAVLRDIIDYCDDAQKKTDEMNKKLRSGKMIIEFLEDVIKDIPERKHVEELNSLSNKMWHSEYDVSREHKDADCLINTQGSEIFENVGKLLISDKSEECCIQTIVIDAIKNEISLVCYINDNEDWVEENVVQNVYRYLTPKQMEEYHRLCIKIVESALIYMD